MEFSADFKNRREKAALSQEEVADLLGVSKRTVSSWETGENIPQPKMRRKIDEIFKRKEDTSEEEIMAIDRTIIIEALCRNVLRQIAKDRAERRGEPDNWRQYLHQIDADTVEEMNTIASRLGLPRN